MTKLLSLSAKIWFQRGKSLKELEHFDDALNSLNKALKIFNPADKEFDDAQSLRFTVIDKLTDEYLNRSSLKSLNKNYQEAIQDLNQALKLKPDFARAYYLRGLAHYGLQDSQSAVKDWNKVLELDPEDASAYKSLSMAFSDAGDYQRALEKINEAIRLKSDESEFYSDRSIIRSALKDYQRAIDDCNTALQLMDVNYDAYNSRGSVYEALGDYQAAIEDYTRSLQIHPHQPEIYNDRGNAFLQISYMQRAIEDYTQAIQIEPKCAAYYQNRGLALSIIGDEQQKGTPDYREAAENYRKAAELFSAQGDKAASLDMVLQARELQEYGKLRFLLAMQKWQAADDETARVMRNWSSMSCEDLRIIDQLWVKYSEGHFGFSVQQCIWKATEGADIDNKRFYGFAQYNGWWNGTWLKWSELTYRITAPKGHLPSGKFRTEGGAGSWVKWEEFYRHVETCEL